MPGVPVQEIGPFAEHSPEQERPLGSYAILIGAFSTATAGFGVWLRCTDRSLPETVDVRDLLLITVATHKATRLLGRDRVTSVIRAPFTRFQGDAGPGEVDEAARGAGLRRAIGELIICPYCMGMWAAAGFTAGLIATPRATRWIATALTTVAGADVLQIVYAKAEGTL
ncbi:MAG: DUF1360 domain-containing protein [Solirubrobacteraceae bacterium]